MIKNTRKRKDKEQCLLLSQELENCNTNYFDNFNPIFVSTHKFEKNFGLKDLGEKEECLV